MAVPVSIFVSQGGQPLPGATVQLLDTSQNFALVGTAVSDVTGRASFLVPGVNTGKEYRALFFKLGSVFPNPRRIVVVEPVYPPVTNEFDVVGTAVGLFGDPADQQVCRCYGRLLNYSRQPVRDAVVRVSSDMFLHCGVPKMVEGAFISVDRMETRTDAQGWFHFDLIRLGEFFLSFSGATDHVFCFQVPNLPSYNISSLIDGSVPVVVPEDNLAPQHVPVAILASSTPFACPTYMAVGDFVYLEGNDLLGPALGASLNTMPSIGVIAEKPTPGTALVQYGGDAAMFGGLVPDTTYYISPENPGRIQPSLPAALPGQSVVLQRVGIARNTTTLMLSVDATDFVVLEG